MRHSPWLLKPLAFLLPIVTFGLGSSPLFGILALRHRSKQLGLAAAGPLIASVVGLVMLASSDDTLNIVGFLLYVGQAFGAAAHAATVVPVRARPSPLDVRIRRSQARQIAEHHPEIARELGIGRPDLPRTFDDGGLIDLNEAPAAVLLTLPGVTWGVAEAIVEARTRWGRFNSTSDLVNRGLMRLPLPDELVERLIVIARRDSVGGPRQNS